MHVATAALPIGLSFGWSDVGAVRAALTTATLLALVVEILRFRSSQFRAAFEAAFSPLLRSHEHRGLSGATWLALSMSAVLWLAPPAAAIAALWAAAVGDAAAAIVGRSVARWRATSHDGKSLVGSIAAFAATALGVYWLTPASPVVAAALGAIAAAAEKPSWSLDDNARVAAAVAICAVLFGLR
jgi:diacylglycerol kinase (CTP)